MSMGIGGSMMGGGRPAEIAQQPPVVPEIEPQQLAYREHELPVGTGRRTVSFSLSANTAARSVWHKVQKYRPLQE